MNNHKQALMTLQQLGMLEADAVDINDPTNLANPNLQENTPWFVQIFFGFSGLLASLFFIGFLTFILNSTGALDSAMAIGLIGLLLNAGGFFLFKYEQQRHSIFLNSLAFTISVAGQSYIIYSLIESDIAPPFSVWLFLLLQSALTVIVPSYMYRLISSLAVLVCVVYLLDYYYLPEIGLGLLALITIISHLQRYQLLQRVPIRWRTDSLEIVKAVGYASALMLLCISVYFIAAEDQHRFFIDGETLIYNYYLAQALLTLASLYAAYLILKRYQVKWQSLTGLMIGSTIAVLGLISIYVSGLLATSLVIIIAMANSQRTLLGIGIFALVCYVFWYYYQLDTSLLVKSTSMLVVGIVLLLVRFLLIKRYFAEIPANHTSDGQERVS